MKQLISLAALGLALALGSAHAAEDKAPTKQQTKMATCNKDATGKTGDARKAFMKECLSNKPATQQDKMKTCNADAKAKTLKGDERKAFMSDCLKN
jgi:uncharacterized protein HemX